MCFLQDDPTDFSFFFDTARRRVCYIAPERFVEVKNTGLEEPAPGSTQPTSSASSAPLPVSGSKKSDDLPVSDTVSSLKSSSVESSTPPASSAKVAINPSANGDMTVSYVAGKEVKSATAVEQRESQLTKEMDVFSLG